MSECIQWLWSLRGPTCQISLSYNLGDYVVQTNKHTDICVCVFDFALRLYITKVTNGNYHSVLKLSSPEFL